MEVCQIPAGTLVQVFGLTGAVHLNGKRGKTNGKIQGDRVGIDFPQPDGTRAVRIVNIMKVVDPSALVRRKKQIGSLHLCHEFAGALWKACVDPAILSRAKAELLPECMVDLLVGDCMAKQQYLLWLKLDAIGHHLLIEKRDVEQWRVYQSHMKQGTRSSGFEGAGYTGLQWVSTEPVGSMDKGAHQNWGQGRILDRKEVCSLFALIQQLRDLSDDLLKAELTQQGPFPKCKWPSTSGWCLEEAAQATQDEWHEWIEVADQASVWARTQVHKLKHEVLSHKVSDDKQTMVIHFGRAGELGPELLHLSMKRANPIGSAYMDLTGEGPTPAIWLKMLEFVTYKFAFVQGDAGPERAGWTFKFAELSGSTGCEIQHLKLSKVSEIAARHVLDVNEMD